MAAGFYLPNQLVSLRLVRTATPSRAGPLFGHHQVPPRRMVHFAANWFDREDRAAALSFQAGWCRVEIPSGNRVACPCVHLRNSHGVISSEVGERSNDL